MKVLGGISSEKGSNKKEQPPTFGKTALILIPI
jgi:hypothetical protein